MGLLDSVKGVLAQYTAGAAGGNVENDFHQVAQSADAGALASGIAAVMHSDQTPPFAQIVSQLFANGSSDQQSAMLKALVGAAPADLQGQLTSMLAGAQGGQAPSSDVIASVAKKVEQSNPGAIDMMSSFYAQHPTLVKTLGSAAMMIAMRKIAEHHAAS